MNKSNDFTRRRFVKGLAVAGVATLGRPGRGTAAEKMVLGTWGGDYSKLLTQNVASRKVARHVDDVSIEVVCRRRPRREDRDAALERLARAQAEREVLARLQHEVADKRAIGIEPGEVVRDENARRRRDRRNRRPTPVEDDDVGVERRGEASAF